MTNLSHRTIVYIDGFNLYYSIRAIPRSKWLDVLSLMQVVLGSQSKIIKIKYFTADVAGRNGDNSQANRQKLYLQALEAHLGSSIEIIKGHFQTSKVVMPRVNDIRERAHVIKSEEKGSDVNLAAHFMHDAWLDAFDCGVVVSNDSDLREALCLVKQQFPKKLIGIATASQTHSTLLRQVANFSKKIRRSKIQGSQLPKKIATAKGKTIEKPESW